jgi:response regulator RpfG family c-di-GMP phosphodiesterase
MPTFYFDDAELTRRHYMVGALLFMFYGVQVCPFIASLSTWQYLLEVSLLFLGMYFLKRRLTARFQMQSVSQHVGAEFKTSVAVFALGAAIMGLGNALLFGFPIESGLKTSVGLLSLGFFIGTHVALRRERALALWCAETGVELPQKTQAFPLTQKFSLFASALIVWSLSIMFLIFVKDLDWLLGAGQAIDARKAQLLILAEVLYVGAFVLAYALLIVRSYADNIALFLENENSALQSVQRGCRNDRVPVGSNDEFGRMARYTNHMIESLQQSEQELHKTRDVTILALASLAETRDNETGAHIIRTQYYVKALAEELRKTSEYRDQLDDETVDLLFKSAPLHDVGKVGIPDAVLLKPGKLTDDEFEVIKQHPMIGSEALARAEETLGSTSFLRFAREISETHHEKWDGSGYPRGLKGNTIPLSGRLMALADVYDALISKRVYKPAFPHEKAKAIILEGDGSHFDPAVVAAFLRCEQTFKDIAAQYRDNAADEAA